MSPSSVKGRLHGINGLLATRRPVHYLLVKEHRPIEYVGKLAYYLANEVEIFQLFEQLVSS